MQDQKNSFDIIEIDFPKEIDHLTGIPNRSTLERTVKESLKNCAGYKKSPANYSLILFDVDYFKSINDLFGHTQGDSVLKDMGALLNYLSRAGFFGLYGRYGGEEFLIAVPPTSKHTSEDLAERVRTAVSEFNFYDVRTGQTFKEKITVTLGISAIDLSAIAVLSNEQTEKIFKDLIRDADTALEYGKFLGKNKTQAFGAQLRQEIKNLRQLRNFYFDLARTPEKEVKARIDRSRNLKKLDCIKDNILWHSSILHKEIDPRDCRTQAVFAHNLYKQINTQPDAEKQKVLGFVKAYLKKYSDNQ